MRLEFGAIHVQYCTVQLNLGQHSAHAIDISASFNVGPVRFVTSHGRVTIGDSTEASSVARKAYRKGSCEFVVHAYGRWAASDDHGDEIEDI